MLTIGSNALVKLGLVDRTPKDSDYICNQRQYDQWIENNKSKIVLIEDKKYSHTVFACGFRPQEFEIVENRPSSSLIADYVRNNNFADKDFLYCLKMSHRYLRNSPHFEKTRSDILTLRAAGATIPDNLKEWYKSRQAETYDYKHPSLKQGKTDFFADKFYVYDHDTIHEAIALYGKPAYTRMKPDQDIVECSKDLFNQMDEKYRLATVYEEACVLALERHQIPNNFRHEPSQSFKIALQKCCTSIASGWWREYAWENYHLVLDLYSRCGINNYVDRFNIGLQNNILKPWVKNESSY